MRAGDQTQETALLTLPPPHDATWQAAVAQTIVDSDEYRTDFVRGVYAKFLTYSVCAVDPPSTPGDSGGSFLKRLPGGWFGLGVLIGVLIVAGGITLFFALERRRFARIYPAEVPPSPHE